MQKLDFGFVILHYMAQQMTEDCVDSLLEKFSDKNIKIVIVDNASKNNSGKFLEEKYANNNLVKVIINKKNLGFACGNNIGFDYLKNNYNIDFMIVMNNDVFIKSQDFLEKIVELYQKHKYAVLGPDIFAPNLNVYQNPQEYNLPTVGSYEYWIKEYKKILRKTKFLYYKEKILKLLKHNQETTSKSYTPENKNNNHEQNTIENCILYGACFIFSKDFINNREYAFYPKTFLYFEEHILTLQCINQKLLIIYSPEIKIEHLCNVSTDYAYGRSYKKQCLLLTNSIKGMKEYIKLYKEYEKK